MSNDLKNLEKVKADLFVERAKMTEGASAATSSTSVKPTPVKVAKAKVPASHYKVDFCKCFVLYLWIDTIDTTQCYLYLTELYFSTLLKRLTTK